MDLGNFDRLEQLKELVRGLTDIMVFIDTVRQDAMIPVTVMYPFIAVLDKIYSLLDEIEDEEKER